MQDTQPPPTVSLFSPLYAGAFTNVTASNWKKKLSCGRNHERGTRLSSRGCAGRRGAQVSPPAEGGGDPQAQVQREGVAAVPPGAGGWNRRACVRTGALPSGTLFLVFSERHDRTRGPDCDPGQPVRASRGDR